MIRIPMYHTSTAVNIWSKYRPYARMFSERSTRHTYYELTNEGRAIVEQFLEHHSMSRNCAWLIKRYAKNWDKLRLDHDELVRGAFEDTTVHCVLYSTRTIDLTKPEDSYRLLGEIISNLRARMRRTVRTRERQPDSTCISIQQRDRTVKGLYESMVADTREQMSMGEYSRDQIVEKMREIVYIACADYSAFQDPLAQELIFIDPFDPQQKADILAKVRASPTTKLPKDERMLWERRNSILQQIRYRIRRYAKIRGEKSFEKFIFCY